MSDANIAVNFSASTSGLTNGIAEVQEKLAGLSQSISDANRTYAVSIQTLKTAISEQLVSEIELLKQKEALLGGGDSAKRLTYETQINALMRKEARETEAVYASVGDKIAGAFNGQLRGLLTGTESFREAMRKTLLQLTIDFIEYADKTLLEWVAKEALKTAATATGNAARTSLNQAANAAELASQGSTIIRSILASAAEAFAGVFGFLAPIMGPFAAGPAAAAQAQVAASVGAVASADIGMYNVPADMLTLVHHNELIMPAAEASSFRNFLSNPSSDQGRSQGVSIAPTTHFHINAIDGASVSNWARSNSSEMLRAINESVRQGAHLGLSRLSRT